MEMLVRHEWPGNVRQLSNFIENSVIFCKGAEIVPENLPEELKEAPQRTDFSLSLYSRSLPLAESTLIRKVLEETGWKLRQAARELEIARGTLYSKIRKYDIKRPI
jgi:transcriptional regulator of acetoin/glycerol metabolism